MGSDQDKADCFIAERITYRFSQPKRGDLIVFRVNGIERIPIDETRQDVFYTKRLVGFPGETIKIRDGHLFVDGRLLDERDGIPPIEYVPRQFDGEIYNVPKDGFFVLGDNSKNSYDSRYWGSVPQQNVYGRVARIYFPFSRIAAPR